MSNVPRVSVRPRGRYVNIDADDTEIGYLTITTEGQVERVWAYDLGDRWLVEVVYECYRAVLGGTTITTSSGTSYKMPVPTRARARSIPTSELSR
jgi:hypothetical protein